MSNCFIIIYYLLQWGEMLLYHNHFTYTSSSSLEDLLHYRYVKNKILTLALMILNDGFYEFYRSRFCY